MNSIFVVTEKDGSQRLLTRKQVHYLLDDEKLRQRRMSEANVLNIDIYRMDGTFVDWLVRGRLF